MRELVKDASGKTVGYKVKCGSQTIVQDASGATLGRHDENTDKTLDNHGRVRYSGDHTDMLLSDESTD
jgi:hypothetical protein